MSKVKTSLNIHLFKEEYDEIDNLIDMDKNPIKIDKEDLGVNYYRKSISSKPKWLEHFFKNDSVLSPELSNSSSSLVLIKNVSVSESENRYFGLTFGYGKYLLNQDAIEDRFGLKTVINMIGPNNIRNINKTEISRNYKKSNEQMPLQANIRDFNFDTEGDLIDSITGNADIEGLTSGNITGSDSLIINASFNIDDVNDLLIDVYNYYLKEDYKEDFSWIDHIAPVKDSALVANLDQKMLRLVKSSTNDFWMAIPVIINWENIKGFEMPRTRNLSTDILLKDVIDSFEDNTNYSIEDFKRRKIEAIDYNDEVVEKFESYKCFFGELDLDNKSYTINNGKWYQVDKDYVDEVNRKYEQHSISNIEFPKLGKQTVIKDDVEIIVEEYENNYNKRFVERDVEKYYNLDAKNIHYGGGYNQVEICDILTSNNELIFVKKYSGSSAMSHLFNQGFVTGELLRSNDAEFIEKANSKIEVEKFQLSNDKEYKIIFAIISNDDSERPNLPFFSKITLNETIKRLFLYGYKIYLKNVMKI